MGQRHYDVACTLLSSRCTVRRLCNLAMPGKHQDVAVTLLRHCHRHRRARCSSASNLRVAKGSNSFPPYLYRAHGAITADPYNYKDLKGATSVVLLDRQRNGLVTIRSHTPGSNLRDMMTTRENPQTKITSYTKIILGEGAVASP